MIEPSSSPLLQRLIDWGLCTPADLRRCRPRVRKLARDLPAFDSVWIDALVQARRLTPFQAALLESDPEEIHHGPCLLVDRLGRSADSATFLARRRGGNERCALKIVSPPPESLSRDLEQTVALAERLSGWVHPFVAGPHAALEENGRLVLVSRYVPGPHLGELLVRRGRFPPAVVAAIARQLVDGLADLERRGVVHGDVRLWNVRLTERGAAVLVDAGVAPALQPELVVNWGSPPERYDGVAPELIGTGCAADAASDLYALGCLMWQLLAGRPPFPTGDPLAKLAAHRTKPVPDVREWAPDTPAHLAEATRRFTAFDRSDRPQSFAEVLERSGPPRRADRRRLGRFATEFNAALPRVPRATGGFASSRWPAVLAGLFVLSGGVLALVDRGARSELLQIAAHVSQTLGIETSAPAIGAGDPATSATVETPAIPGLLPLPAPNAEGVILLETDGPFAAAEVSVVGGLTIRGAPGVAPEIAIADQPLELWAERVALENIHFRVASLEKLGAAQTASPEALVVVRALEMSVAGCSFRDTRQSDQRELSRHSQPLPPLPAAIVWKGLDARTAARTRVRLRNTVVASAEAALLLADCPGRIEIDNCLSTGGGALLAAANLPAAGADLRIALRGTALRNKGAFLRVLPESARGGRFIIDARDCVFHIADGGALFQLSGPAFAGAASMIQMTGEGSLISPGAEIVALHNGEGVFSPAAAPELPLDGLVAASFEFAGSGDSPPECSLISWNAPRRSPGAPGIDPSTLALPRSTD